ncbi:MAG: 2-amino-4-hydroxy-6-hydroxymethyldihydropteridine diphosphokinase [Alloprevotella sp.]|nr:2-amino-4-hydroxy-6-hydroxymethyldihydropteridine diphosphokinase [Alloprevotella sp.]MBR1446669.1 2-amino-4-hydroxy-6-hydroxymethyldihydropteridine diphosphokinase [Alloprevotella sp.]
MLYVGLGSNIGQREENLRRALQALGESVGEVKACSKFYETEPQGFRSNNLFLNAAAAIETTLPPETILRLTQTIERTLGRKHKSQGGVYQDRTIDIDLLLYEGLTLHTPELVLPHPGLTSRRFVLKPLADIAPMLIVGGRTVEAWLKLLETSNEESSKTPR